MNIRPVLAGGHTVIPLSGEMSRSDKRVPVFGEKRGTKQSLVDEENNVKIMPQCSPHPSPVGATFPAGEGLVCTIITNYALRITHFA